MAQQFKKVNGNSASVNISQRPISVKKDIEVANSKTEDEVLYCQHFVNKLLSVVAEPKAPTRR